METVRPTNIVSLLVWAFAVPIALVGVATACWGAAKMPLGERGLFVAGGTAIALLSSVIASIPLWVSRSSSGLFPVWLVELLLLAAAVLVRCTQYIAAIGYPILEGR